MTDHDRRPQENPDPVERLFQIILLPVGVALEAFKRLDGRQSKAQADKHRSRNPLGARTTGPVQKVRRETAKPAASKRDPLKGMERKARTISGWGTFLTALCGFLLLAVVGDGAAQLLRGASLTYFLAELLDMTPFWVGLAAGLVCLNKGRKSLAQVRRFRVYQAMIGQSQTASIPALASAAGCSSKLVRNDLDEMLRAGVFSVGFLDYCGDRLVLTEGGLREEQAPTVQQPPKEDRMDRDNAILEEIRGVKQSISNEKLSAQIDRIGMLTAKILDYQRTHPQSSPQLHSFLSYYLPTTLKILRAYSQLEAQEVAGPNITAAMSRIEEMMDKVVEGFEKQLDQLFQGQAMDITADVAVLEQMLAKDGLAGQEFVLSV